VNHVPIPAPKSLAEFEAGLRGVIGLLGDPEVDAAAIEQTVERLGRLFDELRATSSASLDGALARSAGLNAVARQLAGERLESVAARIVVARQLQHALERTGDDDSTGGYCDVER
jgi:hypothetical protein